MKEKVSRMDQLYDSFISSIIGGQRPYVWDQVKYLRGLSKENIVFICKKFIERRDGLKLIFYDSRVRKEYSFADVDGEGKLDKERYDTLLTLFVIHMTEREMNTYLKDPTGSTSIELAKILDGEYQGGMLTPFADYFDEKTGEFLLEFWNANEDPSRILRD